MITHLELADTVFKRARRLKSLIEARKIQFAGNKKLKTYGTMKCSSGKRMKAENRVFFESEVEAENQDYRPCGHCMGEQYSLWKQLKNQ